MTFHWNPAKIMKLTLITLRICIEVCKVFLKFVSNYYIQFSFKVKCYTNGRVPLTKYEILKKT